MSIREIVNILTSAGIEETEANAEVKLLIEHFCGLTPIDIIMGKKLDTDKLKTVQQKAEFRARTKTPIQHIIGYGYFMGEKFEVTQNTLIPRDETEFLVRKATDIINKNNFKKVLDIGTGSGCISCMIALNTTAKIIGVDISNEAIDVAKRNVHKFGLQDKISLKQSDLFKNIEEKFDVIVSNPPYIPISEKNNLQKEVSYDPDLALYTKDDKGLDFYENISKEAKKFLNKNGYILFEMGHEQSSDIKNILIKNGFKKIEIEKDLAEIDRVISAQV